MCKHWQHAEPVTKSTGESGRVPDRKRTPKPHSYLPQDSLQLAAQWQAALRQNWQAQTIPLAQRSSCPVAPSNRGCRVNPYYDAIGDRLLSAWLVAPSSVWIQTRLPRHARRLAQRSDTRLVARNHAGEFLRTFEANRPIGWAAALIARYQAKQKATNEAFLPPEAPRAALSAVGRVTT